LHQDGIAPAGLLALEEATGHSFQEPIYKGLSWITGVNALGNDFRDLDRGVIWDSMRIGRGVANYWETALSLVNISRDPQRDQLGICYEARPDHYGWLLYAFGRFGLPKAAVSDGGR
jgi:hypothetical protein